MRVGMGLGLLVLSACVRLPDAPTLPTNDTRFQQVAVAEPTGVDQDAPQPLTVLPGDVIAVAVISSETTTYEGLLVDETGRVHLPLSGTVEIGGMPLADAERRIETAVRELDRVARVALRITEAGGHLATVLGAVGTPGRVPVTPGMRLADLLASAGGPGEEVEPPDGGSSMRIADLSSARLIRNGQALPVSVARAIEGDPRHNVRVRPGDHLHVPFARGNLVAVLGNVDAPTVLVHRAGMRLTEALARAGGIDDAGDRTDVHIVRGPLDQPLVYRSSLRAIVNGNATDVVLAAGDVVYVTEEWTSHVGEVLSRIASLLTTPATVALAAGILAQ